MTRLACPFCGPREIEEFSFRKTVPEPGSSAFTAVYERVNRIDSSTEHWQHVQGCRAWLLVRRDPATGQVFEVRRLGEADA